ncbi:autotransporter outer membrane beta-barrel domain-containing protein [Thalassospira sp.]|uniref:autotransporter outer membrane beta-barrel domain-containing protein n=1 Tax=Thalassospira sp. TaxID=1912094 RepID=UPI003AA9BDF9
MQKQNNINRVIEQTQSDHVPVTKWKLFARKWLYALALTGLSLPFANSAFALSAGCVGWDWTGSSNGAKASNQAFSAWEVAKVTFTHTGGNSPNDYAYTFTDNINAVNSRTIATGSTSTGDTVTLTFQIPADTTSATLFFDGDGGVYNITISCVAGSAPAGESASAASTNSAVVGAVSRSQTTVIQQNIQSRISSVSGSANTLQTGNISGETTFSGISGTNSTSLTNSLADEDRNTITDRDDALRHLAMIGSFDSSTRAGLAGLTALGLGPTDQGNAGGDSNIDDRAAFDNATPFTLWGHGSFTSIDSSYVNGTEDNRYDGDVWGYNVGLDYRFSDALTAGLSLGYNDTDLTTSFNTGSYRETGWIAVPYAIYRPVDNLSIIGEAGYGMGDIDVTRDNDTTSGNTTSNIWYIGLTTSYQVQPVETLPLSLTPSLSLLAAGKTVDGYVESNGTDNPASHANTRQIKPSLEAAYDFIASQRLTLTPFLETGLVYDFIDEINNDKTALTIGGGMRLSDTVTGLNAGFGGTYLSGRDRSEYTLSGTVTYGFALVGDDGREMGIIKPFFATNLNEYGNQHIRTGFGFDTGPLTSKLALSHMMSVADDDDDTDTSKIEISMFLPF